MRSRRTILGCLQVACALLSLMVCTASAGAGTVEYWVDTTGSDSAPGDSTNPFKTIPAAMNKAGLRPVGDFVTIRVRPGIYSGPILFPIDQNVKFISEAGPFQTTISGEGSGANSLVVLGASDTVLVQVIDGFTVTNSRVSTGCDFCAGGIQVAANTRGSIYNCIIQGNHSESFWTAGGIEYRGISGTIANNWIVGNTGGAANSAGALYLKYPTGVAVINNTIVDNIVIGMNGVAGVKVAGSTALSEFDNNIVARNAPGPGLEVAALAEMAASATALPIFSHNLYHGNGDSPDLPPGIAWNQLVQSDPAFISASDYHLSCTSPAVDAGLDSLPPKLVADIDGQVRPDPYPSHGGVDIGADELYDDRVASFSASDQSPCSGDTVVFYNESVFPPGNCFDEGWTWDFGDGTIVPQPAFTSQITHVYGTDGSFAVRLIAEGLFPDTAILAGGMEVFPATTADFTAAQASGCGPLTVSFFARMDAPPDTFSWCFGDSVVGTTVVCPDLGVGGFVCDSFLTNGNGPGLDSVVCGITATHTYTQSGKYTVQFSVATVCKTDTVTRADLVVVDGQPSVTISSSHDTSAFVHCAPYTVAFDYLSDQTLTGFLWDFGDSATSTEPKPVHTYLVGGKTYTVTLIASSDCSTDTVEMLDYITLEVPATAAPAASPSVVCAGRDTVIFNGHVGGGVHSTLWLFGDGNSAAGAGQEYVYPTAGRYVPQFVVTHLCGGVDTLSIPGDSITVSMLPEAGFIADDSAGCAPMTVTFTASANTDVDEYAWFFGSSQTPVMRPGDSDTVTHTFATAGAQTVTLRATNTCGSDTVTKAGFVVVSAEPFLSVSSSHDTISFLPCAPYTVEFDYFSDQLLTGFQWDFGDNSTSTEPRPTHDYEEGGKTYSVRLIASGECGTVSEVRTQYITVQGLPAVTPSAGPLFVCAGEDSVTFSAQVSGAVDSTRWLFGNGASGFGTEHQYVYPDVGQVFPQLLVYHPCGVDTLGVPGESIAVSAIPLADFSVTPDSGYEPQSVAFTNLSVNLPVAWSWLFGDGGSSNETDPSHLYNAGTYTVSLEVSNVCGAAIETKTNHIRIGGFQLFLDSIGTSGDTILYSVLVDTLVLPYDQAVNLTAALTTIPRRGTMNFTFTVPSGTPPFTSVLKAVPAGGLASGNYVVRVTADDPLRIGKAAQRDLHFAGTRLISITPVPVALDSAIVGETISKFVKIQIQAADGSGLFLTVEDPIESGVAFSVEGEGDVLAPQDVLNWAVVFTPRTKNPFLGVLRVLSNDPASPDTTVPLSGKGIGEQTPPRVLVTFPENGAETTFDDSLYVEFSEAMEQIPVDTILTVRSHRQNADINGVRRWRSNRRIDFVPVDELRPDDTLTVLLRALVTDTNGNRLDGNEDGIEQGPQIDNYTFTFRTGPAVWPGDTDRDGKVNEADVLPIGRFWKLDGRPRTDPRPGFVMQPARTWDDPMATHADADGNGRIDSADVCPIIEFFDHQTPLPKSAVEKWLAEAQGWSNEIVSALRGALIDCPGEGEGRLVLGRFLESLETPAASVPYDFSLAQNYPNPFNAATVIAYTLTEEAEVRLQVFDIQGRLVSVLDRGMREAGRYYKLWDGRDSHGNEVASGIYFYRLTTPGQRLARKMVLLR